MKEKLSTYSEAMKCGKSEIEKFRRMNQGPSVREDQGKIMRMSWRRNDERCYMPLILE
jgi:hypothetical protein